MKMAIGGRELAIVYQLPKCLLHISSYNTLFFRIHLFQSQRELIVVVGFPFAVREAVFEVEVAQVG